MRKNTMRSPEIRYGVSSIPPTDPSPPSDLPEDHDVSRLPRDDKCAKCGHWDTTLRYVSAYKTSCIGANHPVDEHMHVICNTCEYMWAEMPLSNG